MKVKIVPVASLFTFRFNKNKVKLIRKLYGYKYKSYYSKYRYKRKGIVEYIKIGRSTILVKRDDSVTLKKFFIKNNISFKEHLVILHQEEAKKLNLKHLKGWNKMIEDLKGSKNLLVTVDF